LDNRPSDCISAGALDGWGTTNSGFVQGLGGPLNSHPANDFQNWELALQALPGFRYCIDILIEIRKLSTGHFRNGAPAKALGKNGGAARAKSMTPERCVEIAKSAAKKAASGVIASLNTIDWRLS
jgi:hypothetical protein